MHSEDQAPPPNDRSAGDKHRRNEEECAALRQRVDRLTRERDGYYGEWQHSKNQLREIQRSRMWKLWMLSIDLRRTTGQPAASIRTFGRIIGQLLTAILGFVGRMIWAIPTTIWKVASTLVSWVVRGFGWIYLLLWTFGAGIMARLRPRRSLAVVDLSEEPATIKPDEERLRVLLISPYHIYPADHGGGVRLLNLLRELSDRCDLYLLVFSQMGEDAEQRAELFQIGHRNLR